jgi:hypothetical protein
LSLLFFNSSVQNALKLAYTCICQFKKFSGVIPRPPFQREGREGKREGGIRRNGRKEWEGKMKGKGGGEGREKSVKAGAPKLKFWRRH